ncbi:MAG: hypothetical protein WA981_00805 [Glaciecola sp.]
MSFPYIKKSRQNYYMKQRIKDDTGKENPTADDVLKLIIGEDEYDYNSQDYVLYKEIRSTKRRIIQRVNFLWVAPTLLMMMPFVWILTGEWGFSRNSMLGRFFEFMVKFER